MKQITDCDLNSNDDCRLCGQKEGIPGHVDENGELGEERIPWEKIRKAVKVLKEDSEDLNNYQNYESDLMLHIPSPVPGSSEVLDDIDELTWGTLEIGTDEYNSNGESPGILHDLSFGPVHGNELIWGNQEYNSDAVTNISSTGQSGDLDQPSNELFIPDNMNDAGLNALNKEDLNFSMPSSDIINCDDESIFLPFDSVLDGLPQDMKFRPALVELSAVQFPERGIVSDEFKGNYEDLLSDKLKRHIRVRVPQNDAVTKEVEKISDGQYQCKICKRTFRLKHQCEYHIREHLGKKQFHCYCGKSYPAMYLLKRHSLVHNAILSFVCQQCDKSFRKANSLRSHVLTHNPNIKFGCNECGKDFRYKQDLAFHVQIHKGNFEHVCDICNKGFAKKRDLNLHVKHHLGEKPHNCPVCGKSFLKKSNMKRHTFVHLKDK